MDNASLFMFFLSSPLISPQSLDTKTPIKFWEFGLSKNSNFFYGIFLKNILSKKPWRTEVEESSFQEVLYLKNGFFFSALVAFVLDCSSPTGIIIHAYISSFYFSYDSLFQCFATIFKIPILEFNSIYIGIYCCSWFFFFIFYYFCDNLWWGDLLLELHHSSWWHLVWN